MARLFRRNQSWEGPNEQSAKDSKHGSTKTGSMESYVLLTGDFLHLSFSVLVRHVVSIELYTES